MEVMTPMFIGMSAAAVILCITFAVCGILIVMAADKYTKRPEIDGRAWCEKYELRYHQSAYSVTSWWGEDVEGNHYIPDPVTELPIHVGHAGKK